MEGSPEVSLIVSTAPTIAMFAAADGIVKIQGRMDKRAGSLKQLRLSSHKLRIVETITLIAKITRIQLKQK